MRVSLFVSGCRHRCEGCFNPETWDFSFGQPFTEQTEQAILEALAPDYIQGLTLLGVLPQNEDIYRCDCEGSPSAKLPGDNPVKAALKGIMQSLGL